MNLVILELSTSYLAKRLTIGWSSDTKCEKILLLVYENSTISSILVDQYLNGKFEFLDNAIIYNFWVLSIFLFFICFASFLSRTIRIVGSTSEKTTRININAKNEKDSSL